LKFVKVDEVPEMAAMAFVQRSGGHTVEFALEKGRRCRKYGNTGKSEWRGRAD
jgi:hypothetical protein